MHDNDNETKRALLIVSVIGIFLSLLSLLLFFLLEQESLSSYSTDNAPRLSAEDLNAQKAADSVNALASISKESLNWAPDARIFSCSALLESLISVANGEFNIWSCFIYSAAKQQDTIVTWRNGEITLSEPHLDYSKDRRAKVPGDRIYYDTELLIPSAKAIEVAVNNGLDLNNNVPVLVLGSQTALSQFPAKPVWEVREYGNGGAANLIRSYFIDASSGELLNVSNN